MNDFNSPPPLENESSKTFLFVFGFVAICIVLGLLFSGTFESGQECENTQYSTQPC